ncbi:phosphatase 2C-like domain-containing protein [Lineolata rhizophorae]|uniref:Protein phosphatase n=1 Tax=Lineolata rhizophorae TaxID=578093 RepID=A0A6A6P7P0_9PEZI|nr:phosphatase 2C-like domain-containing protein [Lineolata rhizophorae]
MRPTRAIRLTVSSLNSPAPPVPWTAARTLFTRAAAPTVGRSSTALPACRSELRASARLPPSSSSAYTSPADNAALRLRTSSFHTSARLTSSSSSATAPPRFSYRIAASYSAKGRRFNADRNVYAFNPFVRLKRTATELQRGKRDKKNRPESGQDAFFVAHVGDAGTSGGSGAGGSELNDGALAFGVADGVGGWTDQGIDPADFSHSLCDYMASGATGYPDAFPARKSGSTAPLMPKDLMQYGYDKVMRDNAVKGGGSTACVVTAQADGHFELANLGDSGLMHFSPNAVRFATSPQTHAFNTPYQLTKMPPRILAQMALFGPNQRRGGGGGYHAETPADAATSSHAVRHGDVLVLATDGVWDNLSPADALRLVSRYMGGLGGWVAADGDGGSESSRRGSAAMQEGVGGGGAATLQEMLAVAIAREAKAASLDHRRDGPFAREVQRNFPGENWHGGKADDICVVVAVVVGVEGR